MSVYIQQYKDGEITKNPNGTYNYVVKGKVMGSYPSVKELVDQHGTTTVTKKTTKPKSQSVKED